MIHAAAFSRRCSVMKYEQFLEVYHAGPQATYELLMSIIQINAMLVKRTDELEKWIL